MIEACNGEAKQWQSHIDSCVVNWPHSFFDKSFVY
jgi:hypothetical protein